MAILDLDTFVVLTTGNLGRGYGSWQAAEIQITQVHAGGVDSEHVDMMTHDCLPSMALALGWVRVLHSESMALTLHWNKNRQC